MNFIASFIDPRPAAYREQVNRLAVRDLKDCARWGLHLSDLEFEHLQRVNPDTLGHDDQRLRESYWKAFIAHPSSKPYRIQERI